MELNFSDLSAEEKDKYLQFLVSNNIVFEEEKENSNFVATIKFTQKSEEEIPKSKKQVDNSKNHSGDPFAVAGSFTGRMNGGRNKDRKELKEIQNTYGLKFLKIFLFYSKQIFL